MQGAFIILIATIVTGLLLYIFHLWSEKRNGDSVESVASDPLTTTDEECCGLHVVCEKDLPLTDTPVYYDDEELDRFAGRQPDDFTADEIEEFREVLYTLLPADIYPWGISLTRRNIPLPLSLRDEWLMMVDEYTSDAKNDSIKSIN